MLAQLSGLIRKTEKHYAWEINADGKSINGGIPCESIAHGRRRRFWDWRGFLFSRAADRNARPHAPPAMTAPDAEKRRPLEVTSPSPEAADETPPVSPVIKSPEPEKDLGLQSQKRPSPPKAMARPKQAPKIVSSSPRKIEQENNPMRPTAVPPPETNPIRPGISLAEQRDSAIAAHSAENSQVVKGGRCTWKSPKSRANCRRLRQRPCLTWRNLAPCATAMPDMAESRRAAAEPGAAEPSTTATKAAPADLNEFLKMAEDQKQYTVVKVYYGTDRAAFTNVGPKQPVYLSWLTRTIVAGATALFCRFWDFDYSRLD